ncbi:hypothetical protein C8R44DRAFT_873770 [Mycena epipterygia]|nr:hypothetical protein C8R44DRAFT_873770 [Mycena epipterygia]
MAQKFIAECTVLPLNPYGYWNISMLVDEDLKTNINLHLQELGKEITADKLVEFLQRPDVVQKHGITKPTSRKMAEHYLRELGFRELANK